MNTVNSEPKNQAIATQLLAPDSYANKAKGNKGLSHIGKAASYSLDGFKAAYQHEAAFNRC